MRHLFLLLALTCLNLSAVYDDHIGGSGTLNKGQIIIAGDDIFATTESYTALKDKYGMTGKAPIVEIEERLTAFKVLNQSQKSTKVQNASLKKKADAIILAYGLSDLKAGTSTANFTKAYKALISKARKTAGKVYLCTISPVQPWADDYEKISKNFDSYNKALKSLANKESITLIDLYEVNAENPKYFVDGINPVLYGSKFIADRIYEVVTGDVATSMPMVFTNNMVLQRDAAIPVFGRGRPGDNVKVTWNRSESKTTEVDSNGFWMIKLQAKKADHQGKELSVKVGSESFSYSNILIGDVWFATGQSNMASVFVKNCVTAKEESNSFPRSGYKNIRVLQLTSPAPAAKKTYNWSDEIGKEKMPYFEYYNPAKGGWYEASSYKTIAGMSGVAWFFAKQIHLDHKVPVGIIQSCIGGTSIESYIPHKAFFDEPEIISQVASKDKERGGMLSWVNDPKGANWAQEVAALQRSGLNRNDVPLAYHPMEHSYLYRSGIQPFIPFAIKGAIWYQGESNANIGLKTTNPTPTPLVRNMAQYRALVRGWRNAWQEASGTKHDFAFLAVQLPVIGSRPSWPWYRDAQFRFWQDDADDIENVGVAVTMEFGASSSNVHPYEKAAVSKRLARLAHRYAYKDMDYFYSGPVATSMKINGSDITISFKEDTIGSGLNTYNKGEDLRYFEVAGYNGDYKTAKARIKGKTVVVSSSEVRKPVSIRYLWDKNPLGKNVKEGAKFMLAAHKGGNVLPASPFRFGEKGLPKKAVKKSTKSTMKILSAEIFKKGKFPCVKVTTSAGAPLAISAIGIEVSEIAQKTFAQKFTKFYIACNSRASLKKSTKAKNVMADTSDVALYGACSIEFEDVSLKKGVNYIFLASNNKDLKNVISLKTLSFSQNGSEGPVINLK